MLLPKFLFKLILKQLFEAAALDNQGRSSKVRALLLEYLEDWQVSILISAFSAILFETIDITENKTGSSLPKSRFSDLG